MPDQWWEEPIFHRASKKKVQGMECNEMWMDDDKPMLMLMSMNARNKPTTCPKSALAAALPEKHLIEPTSLKASPALRLAIPIPRISSCLLL